MEWSPPERPVPFGGRQEDMALLDSWLDNPKMPPYLLLAAPAGRGKSALLTRWIQPLLNRSDLAVVFLPISIRFRTNLAGVTFAALTARLAFLHREKVTATPDTPLEVWRGLMTDYLTRPLPDGRRLLLVLDGVDEAADWEVGPDLFPLDPPEGLQIIVSARYLAGDASAKPWLRRLGWHRPKLAHPLDLNPLTLKGVADVLHHMGFPLDRLGARVDIVSELYRLSMGDPLLVRLYVDDLWERGETAARLQPEELREIRPGLEGYLDRWWEDQRHLWRNQTPLREPSVQAVLTLLACALGPLNQEDLLRIAPPEARLTSWSLQETMQPLNRFIVGDGHQHGYTFSHPRLAAYFYEELMNTRERQEVESRLLTFGEETLTALNDGKLLPEHASSYIVQYYGAHLERINANTNALLTLVSNGWQRAWDSLEGTYAGFLLDVERAWRAAERDDETAVSAEDLAPYIGSEVKCALCLASVNSLAKNIPPFLLVELVKKRLWTPAQGLAYAREAPNLGHRAEALGKLLPYMQEQQRMEVMQEALETAQLMKGESFLDKVVQSRTLAEQVLPLISAGYLEQALMVAQMIEEKVIRAEALAALVPYLAESHKPEVVQGILTLAQTIEAVEVRAKVLVKLIPYMSNSLEAEVLQEALTTTRMIETQYVRVELLVALAPYLSGPQLQEALAATRTIKEEGSRAEALAALVPYLPESVRAEVVQEALAATRTIKEEGSRAEALAALVPYLPESVRAATAQEPQETIRTVEESRSRAALLAAVAPSLPEPLMREALEIIRTKTGNGQVEALTKLASHLAELPAINLYPLWRDMLHFLARSTRLDLLANLPILAPAIFSLGNTKAIAETSRAILEVGQWWP
jgi:hypothetical protein